GMNAAVFQPPPDARRRQYLLSYRVAGLGEDTLDHLHAVTDHLAGGRQLRVPGKPEEHQMHFRLALLVAQYTQSSQHQYQADCRVAHVLISAVPIIPAYPARYKLQ